jgi:hypothetical protein
MEYTTSILAKLRALDLSSYPYFKAKELIENLIKDKPAILLFSLHTGKSLTRARMGHNFTQVSDVSYPPLRKGAKCQRANVPTKTMFYGTMVSEGQDFQLTRLIAICECSSLMRGKGTDDPEQITFGRWNVKEDIELVAIFAESVYADTPNNSLLAELKGAYDEYISKHEPDIIAKQKNISNFFAEEFSKADIRGDYDYLLSAIFTEIVTDDFGYDGVMYPSVQCEGEWGFNVAIKPEIVDTNLQFDLAIESSLYKNGQNEWTEEDRILHLKQQ